MNRIAHYSAGALLALLVAGVAPANAAGSSDPIGHQVPAAKDAHADEDTNVTKDDLKAESAS